MPFGSEVNKLFNPLDEIIEGMNVHSSALDFAKKTGLDDVALRGPGPEIMENIFRARMLALRPQINAAVSRAAAAPQRNLGGDVTTGMTDKNTQQVHAGVLSEGMNATMEGARVSEQMQSQAASGYMSVLGQFDQMSQGMDIAKANLRASQPGLFDRGVQVASLAAAFA